MLVGDGAEASVVEVGILAVFVFADGGPEDLLHAYHIDVLELLEILLLELVGALDAFAITFELAVAQPYLLRLGRFSAAGHTVY